MIPVTKYKCEVCNDLYDDPEDAWLCEVQDKREREGKPLGWPGRIHSGESGMIDFLLSDPDS